MSLITFEGIEGCGKSTQMQMLKKGLHEMGLERVTVTQEPGWNKEISGIINYLIKEGKTSPVEKLFLYLADRTAHYEKYIEPIMKYPGGGHAAEPVIICERGPDSTVAYQGFGGLAPIQFLVEANRLAMRGRRVDMTFYLDMDPTEALKRIGKEGNVARVGKDFYFNVRKGYQEIAEKEPSRVFRIDGTASKEAIHGRIWEIVCNRLQL